MRSTFNKDGGRGIDCLSSGSWGHTIDRFVVSVGLLKRVVQMSDAYLLSYSTYINNNEVIQSISVMKFKFKWQWKTDPSILPLVKVDSRAEYTENNLYGINILC